MSARRLTPKAEAALETTAPERLAELAQDLKLARVVAANPAAPASLLENLSHTADKAIRKALVANPATPPQLLMDLGSQFPEQLLENPVFDLLLVENPGLLDQWPRSTVASVLKREMVPEGFLRLAAREDDRNLLLSLLVNPGVPVDVLERLETSADLEVAQAARLHVNAPNPDTTTTVMDRLRLRPPMEKEDLRLQLAALSACLQAGDLQFLAARDRERLACVPVCPPVVLAELAGDADYSVRYSVARNPALPAATLQGLSSDTHWLVLQMLAEHPHCSPEVLATLAAHDNWQVQIKVACHPHCEDALRLKLLRQLVSNPDPDIREAVATSDANLAGVFEDLAAAPEAGVRQWIASKSDCPATVLALLAQDDSTEVRRFLAMNSSCPPDLLDALAEDTAIAVRQSVAANPATPAAVLTRLAQDNHQDLRLSIAFNPSTPVEVLKQLAENDFSQMHLWIASNPACPPDLQQSLAEKLAAASAWGQRLDAARFRRASGLLLRVLAADAHSYVREAVAQQPFCSPEVLTDLARDRDASVRSWVAANRSTPVPVLAQLAQEQNTEVLTKLARNPNLPMTLLPALLAREVAAITQAVAANPSAPEDVLLSLVDAADPDLLAVLAENPSCTAAVRLAMGRTLLGRLAAGSQPSLVRLLAFRSEYCPPEALAKNVRSRDWLERAVIAANPSTPENTLRTLAQDGNRLVREAAGASLLARNSI